MPSSPTTGNTLGRRQFFSVAAGAATGAVLATSAASQARVPGANDRINIGVIGCGNRASALLETMAGFHAEENFSVTAVCDLWKLNRNERIAQITEQFGSKPRIFGRYEDMLASPEVDAVMVTTADHAHSTILAAACRAGKDVFCEKPMAMTVAEASEAVAATRTNGRVVQIGTQRRSDPIYMGGAKLMREGKLGKVNVVELKWNDAGPRWERDYSNVLASDVDWEGYLMDQSSRNFDARRFRCWHLYRDYSIGVVGLLGAHHTDLVHWYMDEAHPESVTATGGVLSWPNREHYDTLHASFKYPGGFLVHYETRFGNSSMRAEAMFYGSEGVLDTKAWKMTGEGRILPERLEPGNRQYPTSAFAMQGEGGAGIEVQPDSLGMDHMRNWVQCIRTRKDPNATVEHGFSHSLAAIMAHRAADIGRRVSFDPVARDIREG
jgi:predicted dehydrogenase